MIRNSRGFTIVELIIVIVVIAILATIGVVVYSGIQETARNTMRQHTASDAIDSVIVALALHGRDKIVNTLHPAGSGSGWSRACVGTGYEQINGEAYCGVYYGEDGERAAENIVPSNSMWESSGFNSLLSRGLITVNTSNFPVIATDNFDLYGPFIQTGWIASEGDVLIVEYALEGEGQDCGLVPLVYYDGSGDLTMSPGDNPKWSVSAAGVTECMILID